MPRDIRHLDVFRRADDLVVRTYALCELLPREEQFGLQAQLRTAAISVPVNLLEGAERRSDRDFARFVEIARGSAAEARYLLAMVRRLSHLGADATLALEDAYDHIVRALQSLGNTLLTSGSAGRERRAPARRSSRSRQHNARGS